MYLTMESKTYTYKQCPDGTEIKADVYLDRSILTTSSPPRPKAIALLIHGGGWTLGSKTDIPRNQIQLLLELNFVPVAIDYRLCPTIGLYDGPITDTRDALTWCQTQLPKLLTQDTPASTPFSVDGEKVVAIGYSSGGHLALMLSQTPHPPQSILSFYGDTSILDPFWHVPSSAAILSNIPPTASPNLTQQIFNEVPAPTSHPTKLDFSDPRIAWTFGSMRNGTKTMACIGDPNIDRVDPKTWYANPEGTLRGKKFPPLMVLHGDQDDLAPLRLSEEMVNCLRSQGSVAEIEVVEGVGHGFDVVVQGQDAKRIWASVRRGYEFLIRYV